LNQNFIHQAILGVMPAVRATGLLVSLATFQKPTGSSDSAPAGTLDDEGFPLGTYEDVTGLIAIPCTAPPIGTGEGISATETKGLEELMLDAPKHVLLDRRYDAVEAGWRQGWRVTIDGVIFDVMGAEGDSQGQMTRVYVRRFTQ